MHRERIINKLAPQQQGQMDNEELIAKAIIAQWHSSRRRWLCWTPLPHTEKPWYGMCTLPQARGQSGAQNILTILNSELIFINEYASLYVTKNVLSQ